MADDQDLESQGQAAEAPQQSQPQDARLARAREIWRRVVLSAMKILYSDEGSRAILAQLRANAQNPVEALASVCLAIVHQIMSQVRGIPPAAVIPTIPAIMSLIMEMADESGTLNLTSDMLGQAVKLVAQMLSNGRQPMAGQPPQQQMQQQPQGVGLIGSAMSQQQMAA